MDDDKDKRSSLSRRKVFQGWLTVLGAHEMKEIGFKSRAHGDGIHKASLGVGAFVVPPFARGKEQGTVSPIILRTLALKPSGISFERVIQNPTEHCSAILLKYVKGEGVEFNQVL